MPDSYINAKAKWAKVEPGPWPREWTAEALAKMEMDAAAARTAEAVAAAARAQAELERAKEVVDMEMAAGMNAPTPTAVEAIQRARVAYNTAVENSSAANNDLIEKMQKQIDAQNTLTAARTAEAAAAARAQAELERAKEVVDMEMAAGMNAPTPTAVEAVQRAMVAYNTAVENSSAANNDIIEKMQEQIDAQNTLTAATGVTAVAATEEAKAEEEKAAAAREEVAMNSSPKKRRRHSKKKQSNIPEARALQLQLPSAPALPPVPPAYKLPGYPNGGTNTKKSNRRYKKRKTKHYKKKTKRYTKKRNMYY
jgi:hypothetical protein